ncbi:hypothetical protein SDC9_181492 [bioreactor metagenome]|uniref:Uncharacterized protein n=1 Tax=bioreactor metagenome TaxID=1076179 RepID=A0A645H5M5_9ZZZZ
MDGPWKSHNARGEHPVPIVFVRRHEAVCGEEDGAGNVGKLFLLILPGGAKVSFKVRIRLQFGVSVGGQHFTVGIDVDSLIFRLIQQ